MLKGICIYFAEAKNIKTSKTLFCYYSDFFSKHGKLSQKLNPEPSYKLNPEWKHMYKAGLQIELL